MVFTAKYDSGYLERIVAHSNGKLEMLYIGKIDAFFEHVEKD